MAVKPSAVSEDPRRWKPPPPPSPPWGQSEIHHRSGAASSSTSARDPTSDAETLASPSGDAAPNNPDGRVNEGVQMICVAIHPPVKRAVTAEEE